MADASEKRRQEAKLRAKKRRRRRATATLLFILIILLCIFALLCSTVLFPIKNVTAKGSKIYSKSDIIKAANITEKDNVLGISAKKTEDKIRKALPFVDTLEISRELPDTVTLTVTDAKEISAVEKDGVFYTLSARGYVLEAYDECPENTFLLVVGDAKLKKGELMVAKDNSVIERSGEIEKLLKDKKIKINMIDVSNTSNIKLQIEDKFEVRLGNSDNLESKIAHMAEMAKSIGDRKGEIDLSEWSQNNTRGIFKAEN